VASPANDYAFVVAKGSDQIAQYTLDAAQGTLAPNPTAAFVHTPAGAGPRHLAFHPGGAWAYVIDENDSTVRAYTYDATKGTLTEMQSISSLPPGFTGANTGAEIQIARSGRFVFVSNRGDDSVVTLSVDAASGKLAYVARTSTGGKTPRHFSLDEGDGVLLAANQASDDVVVFRLDPTTAALTQVGAPTSIGAGAYYVQAISLPAP
jgi:6-phosphogluconolactonase